MPRLKFVVHEHDARRAGLHYDLRLEMGGVLKDWAFRKQPPLEIGVKRYGVQQEDHDLMWLDFEGEIKEGYGAGTMRVWDRGEYEILESTGDKLVLRFYGSRLKGTYVLLRFKEGWLFFKTRA
ncbi:3'-phosphoesterase [Infirmifilum lucidum]|uniref:3'-phosphoesterase n=1 Tax=Infirmifilum lucidum TaxID=2776706 RepID=A0A7L9FH23_9CREN|nr:DNA polymerase ligase N-terminal domain-containing protein [Infirmifilum lucidum]QOJ79049.1 3'-phosphoesterase [Infirmifilum lucidum]